MDPIVEFQGATFTTVPLDMLGGVVPSVGAIVRMNGWTLRVTEVEIDYQAGGHVTVETEMV